MEEGAGSVVEVARRVGAAVGLLVVQMAAAAGAAGAAMAAGAAVGAVACFRGLLEPWKAEEREDSILISLLPQFRASLCCHKGSISPRQASGYLTRSGYARPRGNTLWGGRKVDQSKKYASKSIFSRTATRLDSSCTHNITARWLHISVLQTPFVPLLSG